MTYLTALMLVLVPLVSGCASIDMTKLENRVACTLDGKEAHFLSKWWKFSIGSQIADADTAVICKKDR